MTEEDRAALAYWKQVLATRSDPVEQARSARDAERLALLQRGAEYDRKLAQLPEGARRLRFEQ